MRTNQLFALLLIGVCLPLSSMGQTVTDTLYFDFGQSGNTTSNPDANGIYWNNITNPYPPSSTVPLINASNVARYQLEVIDGFDDSGNLGGLSSPSTSLLDELALSSVTEDYFFVATTTTPGILELSGLEDTIGYRFTFFGTRAAADPRISEYSLTGINSWTGTLQTTGTGIGNGGYNGNNDEVVVSDIIYPSSGSINIELALTSTGTLAYLGAMKVEVIPIKYFYTDFGPDDVTNGNETSNPDANGTYWNNMTNNGNGSTLALVDHQDEASDLIISVTSNTFLTNGINHGGLEFPDASLLSDFAINTVTQDYFFTTSSESLEISTGFANEGYVFSFFGTRETTIARETQYDLNGSNSWSGILATSGAGIGDGGYDGNNDTILQSDTVYTNAQGVIELSISVNTGDFAYLGAMKMQRVVYSHTSAIPLPVTWLHFDAYPLESEGVKLAWGTATEENNDFFEVQRSFDGNSFETIYRMAGAGTTTVPQNYQWVDNRPLNGLNYYRIKQTDYDGTFAYSKLVALKYNAQHQVFVQIFPNPTSDFLSVKMGQSPLYPLHYSLIGMDGKIVQSGQIFGPDHQLNISQLGTGVYVLEVLSGSYVYRRKVIKR